MFIEKVCFAIDNNTDTHVLAKFMRLIDTGKAMNNVRGNVISCIGAYDGLLEPSYIMDKRDFNEVVKNSGYVDNQECILEIPSDTRQPCTLLYKNGDVKSVGAMYSISKEDAMSVTSWKYVMETGTYYTTKGEV
tara:strand:- start:102 stop:503 length:402 start_codon:yes stop_codon:yes gene_type:complete